MYQKAPYGRTAQKGVDALPRLPAVVAPEHIGGALRKFVGPVLETRISRPGLRRTPGHSEAGGEVKIQLFPGVPPVETAVEAPAVGFGVELARIVRVDDELARRFVAVVDAQRLPGPAAVAGAVQVGTHGMGVGHQMVARFRGQEADMGWEDIAPGVAGVGAVQESVGEAGPRPYGAIEVPVEEEAQVEIGAVAHVGGDGAHLAGVELGPGATPVGALVHALIASGRIDVLGVGRIEGKGANFVIDAPGGDRCPPAFYLTRGVVV